MTKQTYIILISIWVAMFYLISFLFTIERGWILDATGMLIIPVSGILAGYIIIKSIDIFGTDGFKTKGE